MRSCIPLPKTKAANVSMFVIHFVGSNLWALVNWNRCIPIPGIIHIHGAQDSVFPLKNIQDPFIKILGDHAIIINKSDLFNVNLPKIINENLVD